MIPICTRQPRAQLKTFLPPLKKRAGAGGNSPRRHGGAAARSPGSVPVRPPPARRLAPADAEACGRPGACLRLSAVWIGGGSDARQPAAGQPWRAARAAGWPLARATPSFRSAIHPPSRPPRPSARVMRARRVGACGGGRRRGAGRLAGRAAASRGRQRGNRKRARKGGGGGKGRFHARTLARGRKSKCARWKEFFKTMGCGEGMPRSKGGSAGMRTFDVLKILAG